MTVTEEKIAIFTKAVRLLDEIYWGDKNSSDNLTVLPHFRETLTPAQREAAEAIHVARRTVAYALIELISGREV